MCARGDNSIPYYLNLKYNPVLNTTLQKKLHQAKRADYPFKRDAILRASQVILHIAHENQIYVQGSYFHTMAYFATQKHSKKGETSLRNNQLLNIFYFQFLQFFVFLSQAAFNHDRLPLPPGHQTLVQAQQK